MSEENPQKSLAESYHGYVTASVDEDGPGFNTAIIQGPDGALTMMALDVPPEQAYQHVLIQMIELNATEAIMGLDRWVKPDQGCTYPELIGGFHYVAANGPHPLHPECFRPFVIEYQRVPKDVLPLSYDHEFWNDALTLEYALNIRKFCQKLTDTRAKMRAEGKL